MFFTLDLQTLFTAEQLCDSALERNKQWNYLWMPQNYTPRRMDGQIKSINGQFCGSIGTSFSLNKLVVICSYRTRAKGIAVPWTFFEPLMICRCDPWTWSGGTLCSCEAPCAFLSRSQPLRQLRFSMRKSSTFWDVFHNEEIIRSDKLYRKLKPAQQMSLFLLKISYQGRLSESQLRQRLR